MSTIQVETFEAAEQTTGTDVAFDNETVELIERLGLEGQKSLLLKREQDGDSVTVRNPYRRMTAEEQRIYDTLCPEHTELAKYDSSAIPLRVLQVAAHATDFFEKIEVWHPKERVDDDPVLVGVEVGEKSEYGFQPRTLFLLARWGNELLPLDELRALAVAKLRRQWESSAKSAIRKAESFLANIDGEIDAHLSGQWVSVPS